VANEVGLDGEDKQRIMREGGEKVGRLRWEEKLPKEKRSDN